MQREPIPNPYLAEVRDWPHVVQGTVDIVDGGWTLDPDPKSLEKMSKAEILSSFTGTGWIELSDGQKIGLSIDGSVLASSMIWPEEFDDGGLFRISLAPRPGRGTPRAENGKLVYDQEYEALLVERVKR